MMIQTIELLQGPFTIPMSLLLINICTFQKIDLTIQEQRVQYYKAVLNPDVLLNYKYNHNY